MGSTKKNGRNASYKTRPKLQKIEVKKSRAEHRQKLPQFQLILGDALAELQKLPEQSADLILSSPPYNIGIRKD